MLALAFAPTLIEVPPARNGRPPQDVMARRKWNEVAVYAASLGHRMERPTKDTPSTLVAQCRTCEGLLAIDPTEKPGAFGPVLENPCNERISLP